MKVALGWLRKREGWTERGAGETVTDQPSQLPTAPIGVRTTGGLHERSRRSCARTTPSVISDWFTDVRGEPCAEPRPKRWETPAADCREHHREVGEHDHL